MRLLVPFRGSSEPKHLPEMALHSRIPSDIPQLRSHSQPWQAAGLPPYKEDWTSAFASTSTLVVDTYLSAAAQPTPNIVRSRPCRTDANQAPSGGIRQASAEMRPPPKAHERGELRGGWTGFEAVLCGRASHDGGVQGGTKSKKSFKDEICRACVVCPPQGVAWPAGGGVTVDSAPRVPRVALLISGHLRGALESPALREVRHSKAAPPKQHSTSKQCVKDAVFHVHGTRDGIDPSKMARRCRSRLRLCQCLQALLELRESYKAATFIHTWASDEAAVSWRKLPDSSRGRKPTQNCPASASTDPRALHPQAVLTSIASHNSLWPVLLGSIFRNLSSLAPLSPPPPAPFPLLVAAVTAAAISDYLGFVPEGVAVECEQWGQQLAGARGHAVLAYTTHLCLTCFVMPAAAVGLGSPKREARPHL